ncbi:hypothetical protein HBI56_178060 [Parastagonospora nodorum]|uniref:Uncharacterized protein n=1 Tax=Phaeosphaeria nodorum (strain SN15 / ATCC MYA-4574 / FGSC 10173) TaxID=321614 RepID=A0A7U2HW72_PHANO|nr:hypothetical protein HBH56_047240 [Parastagonospora nodorum]QRC92549.1 hypothetical protein JI435_083890 [Parastagonospora nodorum SN15]KAH3933268.1 hypothetical protein HBH54_074980 [Parastagonospora nodorum]KAH3938829.1 hypothetical protein HBH53_244600 [Parastagonospora nodorum]KAH3972980.1 hypothetical protein HBH52_147030 [Parastagonospora nodorum]
MNQKICLVTGCSAGGVGPALVEAFKNKGYHVFATARSPKKVPQALHSDPNITVLALDVTSTDSITAAAAAVSEKTGGKLDVLINNAGHGLSMPALDTSIEDAKQLFNANFFGVLEMVQAFSHMLIKSKGVIVNNSSVGAYQPFPFITIYQASKAALITAGEGWRLELAPLGVRVITLVTGGIATNFVANLNALDLPEKSYYKCVEDTIAEQPEHIPFSMAPERFALHVLQRVERGGAGKYWAGGGTVMMRVALWVLPQALLDVISMMPKPFAKKLREHRDTVEEQDHKLAVEGLKQALVEGHGQ